MNLLRRRMMMQTMESGAKYPLVNGRHEFDNGCYVEVTNGNHVLFHKNISGAVFVILSDIFQNNIITDFKNVNNKPKIYTIPSEKVIRFEVKNVQGSGIYSAETNFKLANSVVSASFKTGPFLVHNPEYNTIIEKILEIPEDVGCLFMYSNMEPLSQIEFDVEFTVNGERWI